MATSSPQTSTGLDLSDRRFMSAPKPLIYDVDYPTLVKVFQSWGEPEYRARQTWHGLYKQFWNSPDQFTTLPNSLRHLIADAFTFSHLQSIITQESKDGETLKTLFELPDSNKIEAVLMRYSRRRTLCISTQAGCAMGCVFCATGQMGLRRNLSSGEIVEQVLYYARQLSEKTDVVTNIVFMGMGEPFHNYESTLSAIDLLGDLKGYNFGARRFTISTVGVIPGIKRFTAERRQVNLAISLHAADDNLRSKLLPINKRYPLDELFVACQDYVNATSRRITFEWALISGVNDTSEQAESLARLLQAFRRPGATLCHVNIIRLNPTMKYGQKATSHEKTLKFQEILERNGVPCTIRLRRGIDIQAGCGQLAAYAENQK